MHEGAPCSRCAKFVIEHGGVVCARRRSNGEVVGCGAGICWRCMNRATREEFGAVKTTKAEFASMGETAWWMHGTCMAPEDEEAYFCNGEVLTEDEDGAAESDGREGQRRFAWEF